MSNICNQYASFVCVDYVLFTIGEEIRDYESYIPAQNSQLRGDIQKMAAWKIQVPGRLLPHSDRLKKSILGRVEMYAANNCWDCLAIYIIFGSFFL